MIVCLASPITPSDAQFPAPWRGIASTLLMVAIVASVAASIYIDINKRFTSGNAEYNQDSYTKLDRGILATHPRQAVLLRIGDFDMAYQQLVASLYFRSVYLLYPVPVSLGDPTHFINNYKEIWEANVPRDDAWLRSHHIDVVLTYTMIDQLSADIRNIDDHPAKTDPDRANQ